MSTDETLAVLKMLEAQADLSSFKLFPDLEIPPEGYQPADGIGVCFKVRGGSDGDPSVLTHPSFQFKIYGLKTGEPPELTCRIAARTLHDNFTEKSDANILTVYREVMPVTLKEPETDWTYVLVFYKVMVRSLS